MEQKITKKVREIGNGVGVLLDAKILYKADIKVGDFVEVKCSKNRVMLKKMEDK